MTLEIATNNVPRDVIDGWQLGPDERSEFDYVDWDAVARGESNPTFFRYKGELYDLGEFTTTSGLHPGAGHHDLSEWDGYSSDSFFSGLVVRYVDNFEAVIVGRYYA